MIMMNSYVYFHICKKRIVMLIISYDCIKTREGTDIRGVFRKYETEEIRMRQGRKADEHLSGKAEKRMYHRGEKRKLRREKEETGRENLGDRLAISH